MTINLVWELNPKYLKMHYVSYHHIGLWGHDNQIMFRADKFREGWFGLTFCPPNKSKRHDNFWHSDSSSPTIQSHPLRGNWILVVWKYNMSLTRGAWWPNNAWFDEWWLLCAIASVWCFLITFKGHSLPLLKGVGLQSLCKLQNVQVEHQEMGIEKVLQVSEMVSSLGHTTSLRARNLWKDPIEPSSAWTTSKRSSHF